MCTGREWRGMCQVPKFWNVPCTERVLVVAFHLFGWGSSVECHGTLFRTSSRRWYTIQSQRTMLSDLPWSYSESTKRARNENTSWLSYSVTA